MIDTAQIQRAGNALSSPAYRAAMKRICDVATILAGSDDSTAELGGDLDPTALGRTAFASGTGPLLGSWVESGRLHAHESHSRILRNHLDHSRRRARAFEEDLSRLLEKLNPLGIVPTVLKGYHTSREYFPEPGARPATDVDILVDPGDLKRVEAELTSLGYARSPAPDSHFRNDWRHPDSPPAPLSLDFTHAGNARTIDLHNSLKRTIVAGTRATFFQPTADTIESWHDRAGNVTVLRQPYLLAFLAVHACERLRETQLVRIIELSLILRADANRSFDWDSLLRVLFDHELDQFALPALKLCDDFQPDLIPGQVLAALKANSNRRMMRVLSRISPSSVQAPGAKSLDELLLYARGPVATARAMLYTLLPVRRPSSLKRLPRIFLRRVKTLLSGGFTFRIPKKMD